MVGSFRDWKEYYDELYPRYGRVPSLYYSWFNYRHFNRDYSFRDRELSLWDIILSRNR